MKERRTFLLPGGSRLAAADVVANLTNFSFSRVDEAALERRVTTGLSEFPQDIQSFLKQFEKLHVRLATARNDDVVQTSSVFSPVVSRMPAGLHVFFTPKIKSNNTTLCDQLQRFVAPDVKCLAALDSFIKLPVSSKRAVNSPRYQFYHPVFDASLAVDSLRTSVCSSHASTSAVETLCSLLTKASTSVHVDVDYDAVSRLVTVTALWTPQGEASIEGKTHRAVPPQDGDRLEIGVLQKEKADEAEELSLGGLLTVIGEADHASATLFAFPARHHPAAPGLHYTAAFSQPSGLHPKLTLTFPRASLERPRDACTLHAYWTLPSTVFIDRYQLSDSLFLESQNLVALRSLEGEQDLEAPEWAVSKWGSVALLELTHPKPEKIPKASDNDWTVTIPTHLRYIASLPGTSEQASVQVPSPVVFWACEGTEGLKMTTNPFDRVDLGYDSLFGPTTIFYHIPPSDGHQGILDLAVPTLFSDRIGWVPLGTMAAVVLGFGWICLKLLNAAKSRGHAQVGDKKSL